MEIYELRSFVVLAEQLHFGRAAEILHLSQPALTKQIRRLEESVGGALFERGPQGTRLSQLGAQILASARDAVLAFDRVREHGRLVAEGVTGRLRLGFGFHTLELVPRVMAKFRQSAPRVEMSLRDMSSSEQAAALEAGQIDLGFLRLPVTRRLEVLPVAEDRLALVVAEAKGKPVRTSFAQCRDEPFVMIAKDRSPGFHAHTFELCARHGFHPRIVQEVREFTTAVALAGAGIGVTVIPASFQLTRFNGVRVTPLKGKEAIWSVGAAWRPQDSNPALRAFLQLLRAELKSGTRAEQ